MAEHRRNVVRLMRKDVSGDVRLERSLAGLKGIGNAMARAIRIKSGFPKNITISEMTPEQHESLTKLLENISKQNFPPWLLNRRKDYSTGITQHLLESELDITQREDIQRMKRVRSYKGLRHMYGLKVRGQRTRSTGRTGGILGVMRKGTGVPAPAGKPGAPAAGKPAAGAKPAAAAKPAAKKEEKK